MRVVFCVILFVNDFMTLMNTYTERGGGKKIKRHFYAPRKETKLIKVRYNRITLKNVLVNILLKKKKNEDFSRDRS